MPQGRWGHRLLLPALGTKGQGCSPPYPSAWGSSPPAHPPSLGSWQPLGPGRARPAPAVAPGLWHRPQGHSAPALPGPWCQLCPIPSESRSLQRLTGPGPFTGPCACPRHRPCRRRPSAIGDNKVLEPTAVSCAARGGAVPTGTSHQRTGQMVAKGWQQLREFTALYTFLCSTGQAQLKLSFGHMNLLRPLTVSRMFLCSRCIKIIKLYGALECITAIRKSQKMTRLSDFCFF